MYYFERILEFDLSKYHGKAEVRVWTEDDLSTVLYYAVEFEELWSVIDEEISHYGSHDYSFRCPDNNPLSAEDHKDLKLSLLDLAFDGLSTSGVHFSQVESL